MDTDSNQDKERRLKQMEVLVSSLISLPAEEKRNEDTEKLVDEMEALGVIYKDFNETDDNKYLKSQFIKAILVYDELQRYDGCLFAREGTLESFYKMWQDTKDAFLPLALLKSYIGGWNRYHVLDKSMNDLRDKILPGLEFANHVRNKITGHIENDVIYNSIQWEPTIFQDSYKGNQNMQRFLIYRSLLESAINSYVDSATGLHKIFKNEIDVFVNISNNEFYGYLRELIRDSLEYLRLLIETMDDKIVYFSGLPANVIKNAANTDFKTKNKGR